MMVHNRNSREERRDKVMCDVNVNAKASVASGHCVSAIHCY